MSDLVTDISDSIPPWHILSEDGPVLAINKPSGLLTLGAAPRIPTLEREIKAYLKQKYGKPGNVYLGVVHRLDRPVSGVILFTRNSKAAGRLAEQFRERQIEKIYWGITDREPEQQSGTLIDWLLKVPDKAEVEVVPPETPGARQAVLHYRVVGQTPLGSLLEIQLETGRMHQIRVQLASRGWPIRGDIQYGSTQYLADPPPEELTANPIALHARQISFLHPVRYDSVTIAAPVPANWGDLGLSTEEIASDTGLVFPKIAVIPDSDDEEG
ncbi:MAG: truC [Planctomycetaceae bacterium]|nr:truC [Planctomycetaceae bacterium]